MYNDFFMNIPVNKRNLYSMIFIFLFFFIIHFELCAQANTSPAEVFIIGTLHNGNRYINHQTLHKVLIELKPDVILWEYNEDFKAVFGLRTARFLKIAKPQIEQLALQKYAKKYSFNKIFGFDTTIADRMRYKQESTAIDQKIFQGLDTVQMEPQDSIQLAAYLRKSDFYYDYIVNSGLKSINSPRITDTCRILYQWDMERIVPLSKKYISDGTLIQQYATELDYWHARNNYMVKKILNYIHKYSGKRFVILTGLNHKYFLTDGLSKHVQGIFTIKEWGENIQ